MSKLDMDKVDDRLAKMYTSEGDRQAQYDRWAASYDSDLVNDLDYVAHLRTSEIFSALIADKNAKVLDMGCGTGLVGAALHKLGYTDLDGADFSAEMLEIATRRGVYQSVFRHDVSQPLANTGKYDALISVGLFAYGAPHITELPNLVTCVARGCRCVVTVNGGAWADQNIGAALHTVAAQHQFEVEEIIETEYIRKQGINAQVLIIRR